jgi:hypothetical protein
MRARVSSLKYSYNQLSTHCSHDIWSIGVGGNSPKAFPSASPHALCRLLVGSREPLFIGHTEDSLLRASEVNGLHTTSLLEGGADSSFWCSSNTSSGSAHCRDECSSPDDWGSRQLLDGVAQNSACTTGSHFESNFERKKCVEWRCWGCKKL